MQERERQWQATEANNGVWLQTQLVAVPADEEAARARGIKRATDKVRGWWVRGD